MLSTDVLNQIMRLRGTGEPLLDYVADVLTDAFAAQNAEFVGQLKVRGNPDQFNPGVEPPDHPKIPMDLPAVVSIDHPTAFQKPGDEGPNGGCALKVRGPSQFTPNRVGDIAIDVPHGAIDAQQLYQDGEPVIVIPPLPESGTWTIEVVDGVLQWAEVDASSCP